MTYKTNKGTDRTRIPFQHFLDDIPLDFLKRTKGQTGGWKYRLLIAAMIFGKWRPVPAMFACLLFGFLDAVAARLQGVSVPGIGEISVQFIEALPYLLTVILLAGFIGRALAPRASGIPYTKER